MPDIPIKVSHKLGANRHGIVKKTRKRDPNFVQSRDIYEDRGGRRMKEVRAPLTFRIHLDQNENYSATGSNEPPRSKHLAQS